MPGRRWRIDQRGMLSLMGDQDRAELLEQLRRVIAWEIEAQLGVHRAIEAMPPLIADTLLDYFDIALKPGADLQDLA